MSEKYGFVYVWYDVKRKKFYIGAHWGWTDDNYICSSEHMLRAIKKRPEDFRRKVVATNISVQKDLWKEERRWLGMIDESKVKIKDNPRYYNLTTLSNPYWNMTKEQKEEYRENLKGRKPWNKGKSGHLSKESIKRLSDSLKGPRLLEGVACGRIKRSSYDNMLANLTPGTKGMIHSEKTKKLISKVQKERLWSMTPEERKKERGHTRGRKWYYCAKTSEARILVPGTQPDNFKLGMRNNGSCS